MPGFPVIPGEGASTSVRNGHTQQAELFPEGQVTGQHPWDLALPATVQPSMTIT